jgi:hypothetical protein
VVAAYWKNGGRSRRTLICDSTASMACAFATSPSLEALDLNGPAWRTPEAFGDGEALLAATSAHGLEGVVAKRRDESYRPRKRGWVKVKHRHYWRFGQR